MIPTGALGLKRLISATDHIDVDAGSGWGMKCP